MAEPTKHVLWAGGLARALTFLSALADERPVAYGCAFGVTIALALACGVAYARTHTCAFAVAVGSTFAVAHALTIALYWPDCR